MNIRNLSIRNEIFERSKYLKKKKKKIREKERRKKTETLGILNSGIANLKKFTFRLVSNFDEGFIEYVHDFIILRGLIRILCVTRTNKVVESVTFRGAY